jgi:heterodisulfide reductase subunit A
VAQSSGAAGKVVSLFSEDLLLKESTTVIVKEELCTACGACIEFCPYDALELDAEKGKLEVIEVLCEGCGSCVASCLCRALQLRNMTDRQVFRMVEALLSV